MVSINRYISLNFTKSFLTIFVPFFVIISLIYLVKISSLTAQLSLSFNELILLYIYSIPSIIFYTIPTSFVASVSSMLSKLSLENELIALYSLGNSSKHIIKHIYKIALLFTLLLLGISFLLMPSSKQAYKNFKAHKKAEAKLNIVPGQLGQKFGKYYIYVESLDKNKLFNNIVIYNKSQNNKEEFFAAKKGKLSHQNKETVLTLTDGYGYTYNHNYLQEARYQNLIVYESVKSNKASSFDIIRYWGKAKTDLSMQRRVMFMIFISIIPLLTIYFIASFTMINPRYHKNHSFLVTLFSIVTLYAIASFLDTKGSISIFISIVILIFIITKQLFKHKVSRYF